MKYSCCVDERFMGFVPSRYGVRMDIASTSTRATSTIQRCRKELLLMFHKGAGHKEADVESVTAKGLGPQFALRCALFCSSTWVEANQFLVAINEEDLRLSARNSASRWILGRHIIMCQSNLECFISWMRERSNKRGSRSSTVTKQIMPAS